MSQQTLNALVGRKGDSMHAKLVHSYSWFSVHACMQSRISCLSPLSSRIRDCCPHHVCCTLHVIEGVDNNGNQELLICL